MREKAPPRRAPEGRWTLLLLLLLFVCVGGGSIGASDVSRPTTIVTGRMLDMTGAVLPGATVDLLASSGSPMSVVSDARGEFTFESIASGRYEIVVQLLNFTTWREAIPVTNGRRITLAIVLDLALSADVVVSGRRTFRNLVELGNPRENLVGVAASASEGAVTGRQLDTRPILRSGEVLESVPGFIVSQHSGRGRPTSITSEASTWITGPISRRPLPASR